MDAIRNNTQVLATDYEKYAIIYNCLKKGREQVTIVTRDNFPGIVEKDLQTTIEEQFIALFGPEATDADHEPLLFSEDVSKTNQQDDCDIMNEIDYREDIPTNWSAPMFSRSRIAVIKPDKRVNAPEPWVYAAPGTPVELKDVDEEGEKKTDETTEEVK